MIKFVASGKLNVSTEPSLLPSQMIGKDEVSESLSKCKNIDVSNSHASTRLGLKKISKISSASAIVKMFQVGLTRYEFTATDIYRNETLIKTISSPGTQEWACVAESPYGLNVVNMFTTNGRDKYRIQESSVYEWGVDAPVEAPSVGEIEAASTGDCEVEVDSEGNLKSDLAGTMSAMNFTLYETGSGGFWFIFPWEEIYAATGYDASSSDQISTFAFEEDRATSTHNYRVVYTYCRYVGGVLQCESNPSPSTGITAASVSLKVQWDPSPDSQVTHVRIYRTLKDGASYLYAGRFPISAPYAICKWDDTELGSEVEIDHDRIPDNVHAVDGPFYNGIIFAATKNRLYFCKPGYPEYWPAAYYIEVGARNQKLRAIKNLDGSIYMFTQKDVYQLYGSGPTSFYPVRLWSDGGAFNNDIVSASGFGIVRLCKNGFRIFNGVGDKILCERELSSLFKSEPGEVFGTLESVSGGDMQLSHGYFFNNKIFYFYSASGGYPRMCIVYDILTQQLSHYDYGIDILCGMVELSSNIFYLVGSNQTIYRAEYGHDGTDDGNPIEWELQSKDFRLLQDKYFIRVAKYDADLCGNNSDCVVEIRDGDLLIQSHNLVQDKMNKQRLVKSTAANGITIAMSGKGNVTIRGATLV